MVAHRFTKAVDNHLENARGIGPPGPGLTILGRSYRR